MEFTNTITITMENNEAADTALETIKKVICSGDYSENYRTNTAMKLANDLQVKGTKIVQVDYNGYFIPEDISSVMEDVLKAIAKIDSVHRFECEVFTDSTYSEDEFEATYKKGLLKIKVTYLPSGYWEYLSCPVCGEDIVKLEEFDPNKEYVCPVCGEVINLKEQYEETAPVVEEKEYHIA